MEKTEKTERTDSQTEQRRKQRTNGEEWFDGVAKRRTRTNRIGNHEHLESCVVRGSDPIRPPSNRLRCCSVSSVPPFVKSVASVILRCLYTEMRIGLKPSRYV